MEDSSAPERNEKGQLLPGNTANPNGNNGHLEGWQRYGTRLQKYLDMPSDELDAIVTGPEFKKYSNIDKAAILQAQRIGDATHAEHIPERERGLDRVEGKARQTHRHGGDADNPSPINLGGKFTLVFGTDGNDDGATDDSA